MSLNPVGVTNYSWNYSKPNSPDYTPVLTATVLGFQEIQQREYNPNMPGQGRPMFWNDGNPRMNIRMIMVDQTGQLKTFIFQPAGKAAREGKKRSIHMDLFALTGNTNMTNLIGKTITLSTSEPQVGRWGQGNPRPFDVVFAPEGTGPFKYDGELPAEFKIPKVLCNESVSGGQMQQQQFQPQIYQQPMQPQYQSSMQQQMVPQQQPIQQAYQQQPQTPMAPQMPAMDPNVMAAMQQLGATNIQPVQSPYDSEIPF